MAEENLCVLIDFENIAAGTERENLGKFNIRMVMNRLKDKGRILVSRAYGDWGRFAKFKQHMLEQGIHMMELTSYRGQEKNRADIALVVDAMELAFTREYINTYVLLSGDSDFTPLVMKLRELNKRVIGLGVRKSTSRLLSESCDEFIFYDNLLKRAPKTTNEESENLSEEAKTLTKDDAFALLVETLEGLQREHPGPVQAGSVKQFMLRKLPTFDETDFGYSGFTRFLESGQKRGLVRLFQNDKGGGYNVDLYDSSIDEPQDSDPYTLPIPEDPEVARLQEILVGKGFHPTTQFIRHTVVHEFADHILERRALKKRNTLVFTYGDINRRCRKTDPIVPSQFVREIIDALHSCGELVGSDSQPVRSKKANFVIRKDAEELLESLRHFYLQVLFENGETGLTPVLVSQLLWSDTEHLTESEALLRTLEHNTPDTSIKPTVERDDDQDSQSPPAKKPRARKKTTKKPAGTNTGTVDAPAEAPASTENEDAAQDTPLDET